MSRTDINQTTQPIERLNYHQYRIIYQPGSTSPMDVRGSVVVSTPIISSVFRKGSTNPNFHKLKAIGNLPPNAFQYHERTWRPRKGTQVTINHDIYHRYDEVVEYQGCWDSRQFAAYINATPSITTITNVLNQSLVKARLKLKDQDVNLAEVWGERHESLNMIRNNADRIGKAYAALRHGNFRDAAAALGVKPKNSGFGSSWRSNQSKAVANGWLELQYGWRPLLADVYGALEALHKGLQSPKMSLVRVVGTSQFSDSSSTVTPITAGSIRVTRSYDLEAKTCLYYRQSNTVLHTLAALGITNPLYLSWELTKYSFVVDWFVHIGDFLSSLDATLGYTWAFGCQTTAVRSKESIEWNIAGYTTAYQEMYENSYESDENLAIDRGVITQIEAIPIPTFKDPRSLEHALNSIALLRQSIRR